MNERRLKLLNKDSYVSIYDDVLETELLHKLYITACASPFRAWRIADPSKFNGPVTLPCDYLQCELDLADFEEHLVFKSFFEKAQKILNKDNPKLKRAFFNVFQFGDTTYPHKDFVEEEGSISLLLFLNEEWEPEWEGELYFFEDNYEPTFCVKVKPNRIVAFDSDTIHRPGIPSRVCPDVRLTLNVRFV